jgi:hypothetical protein
MQKWYFEVLYKAKPMHVCSNHRKHILTSNAFAPGALSLAIGDEILRPT